jgi:hypothetical protein
MERFLNIAMMKEPLNWVTIFLMCLFALVLLYLVFPQQIQDA